MIKHVTVFQNGMVMVFDEHGQQIPEYQGFILEVAEKLQECSKDTKFSFGIIGKGEFECDFSWWFENRRGRPSGM